MLVKRENQSVKKERIKSIITWSCCEQSFESVKQLAEHLQTVHNVKAENISRKETMRVDMPNFYTSQYEWTVGEIKFWQTCDYAAMKMASVVKSLSRLVLYNLSKPFYFCLFSFYLNKP